MTVSWSGIAPPANGDWVALYATSAAPNEPRVAYTYTGGTASGSLNLNVPIGATPGTDYQLRLFANNSYTLLATSAPITVS
jgi:hypothetical protein